MHAIKKFIFRLLGLGASSHVVLPFCAENAIYINIALHPAEASRIERELPPGLKLKAIHFTADDKEPVQWLCYNTYYVTIGGRVAPRARCEVSVFVEDANGERGFYMFGGSPLVSVVTRDGKPARVDAAAERLVMRLYGSGSPAKVGLDIDDQTLSVDVAANDKRLLVHLRRDPANEQKTRFHEDFLIYTARAYYHGGHIKDLVYYDHSVAVCRLVELPFEGCVHGFERTLPWPGDTPTDVKVYYAPSPLRFCVDAYHRRRPSSVSGAGSVQEHSVE